jgi:Zn finger protein HypA/HybF involved in hydrogenase expression
MSDDKRPDVSFDPVTNVWDSIIHNPIHKLSMVAVVALAVSIPFLWHFDTSLKGMPLRNEPVQAPKSADQTRAVLIIDGNRDNYVAEFKHAQHQEMLGGEESCAKCHHIDKPNNLFTACFHCHSSMAQPTAIFNHTFHINKLGGNKGCNTCHPDESKPKWRTNAVHCSECHSKDMRMQKPAASKNGEPAPSFNYMAPSYADAMHKLCIECHRTMDLSAERKQPMEECNFCHAGAKKTHPNIEENGAN